jgi:class 3 adenylate cyclase
LGRTILASEDFVDHCGDDDLQPLGRFAVAGFAAEQMVFGLADEDLATEALATKEKEAQ